MKIGIDRPWKIHISILKTFVWGSNLIMPGYMLKLKDELKLSLNVVTVVTVIYKMLKIYTLQERNYKNKRYWYSFTVSEVLDPYESLSWIQRKNY